MPAYEERPLDEDVDNEPTVMAPTALELETLDQGIYGAIQAAGVEETERALEQVASGAARPQELLEWIDDLRDSEHQPQDDNALATGLLPDFAADTEMASGDAELPPPAGAADLPLPDSRPATFSDDDDLDYVFPATRRRRRGDLDDDDDDEGDPFAREETKRQA